MIQRAELVRLLTRACDAISDELAAAGHDDVEDHPILRGHRELADEIDRALAGEKRRVDDMLRSRLKVYTLDERRRVARVQEQRRGLRPKGTS